jgi:hypothetical protein
MIKFREKLYSTMEENMQIYHSFLDFEERNGLLGDSPIMYMRNIGHGFSQIALLYSKRESGVVQATGIFLKDRLYQFTAAPESWPQNNDGIILGLVGYVGNLKKDILADLNYRRRDANVLQAELDFLAE